MENEFLVSVVIPVYNNEKYSKKAVLSAHESEDGGEKLLAKDGSTDCSCQLS
jgi:glycosyltransferase involved in cell wall biosynthesis